MTADITAPHFTDETKAREALEAIRWPSGPVCPFCGCIDNSTRMQGKTTRPGLLKCNDCRKPYSVTIGTLYERSHIPLHKWLLATHLLASSKKGISAHQLHRMLGITYKSAWFMTHRIRESMGPVAGEPPLGGEGKTVEADETYIGRKRDRKVQSGTGHKHAVVSLVERNGRARSFKVDRATPHVIRRIVEDNASPKSALMSDEAIAYKSVGKKFASHEAVNHSKDEYVRGLAHTNTVEGFYSIFKRGMKGVYQHCGEQHLQRYLHEFDFRYSNRTALGVSDKERAEKALKGIEGKRLTYRRTYGRTSPPSLG